MRFRALSIVTVLVASIAGRATAQQPDTNSDDKSQSTGRGWSGNLDPRFMDRMTVDGIWQLSKGQIELANFALKQTHNENVRKFAQTSIDNCQRLNDRLQAFVQQSGGEQNANPDRWGKPEDAKNETANASGWATGADKTAGQTGTSWNARNLAVVHHDIANQVTAGTERELAQYQGAEFDRAFVGQQFWGQVRFLAVVKAGNKQASNELRKIINQATIDAEKQLDDCRRLVNDPSLTVAGDLATTPTSANARPTSN